MLEEGIFLQATPLKVITGNRDGCAVTRQNIYETTDIANNRGEKNSVRVATAAS